MGTLQGVPAKMRPKAVMRQRGARCAGEWPPNGVLMHKPQNPCALDGHHRKHERERVLVFIIAAGTHPCAQSAQRVSLLVPKCTTKLANETAKYL